MVLNSIELGLHDDFTLQSCHAELGGNFSARGGIYATNQSALLERMTSRLAPMPDAGAKGSAATCQSRQIISQVKAKVDRLSKRAGVHVLAPDVKRRHLGELAGLSDRLN